jgi:hypothetical protein
VTHQLQTALTECRSAEGEARAARTHDMRT